MDSDLSRYKALFLQTAILYLSSMHRDIDALQRNPSDIQAIERLHRSAHSLKSQCLFMQFEDMGQFCKTLEFYFSDIKMGRRQFDRHFIPLLQHAIEKLQASLATVSETGDEIVLGQSIQETARILGVTI